MLGNITKSIFWKKLSGNVAAGVDDSEVDGADIDARGFDRALFIFELGAVTSAATLALQIQESVDGETWADITGAGFTAATATGKSDDTILIDVPVRKGYVRYQYDREGQSIEIDAIQVALYNSKKIPVDQNADVWKEIVI
jgi:hypothetical protein